MKKPNPTITKNKMKQQPLAIIRVKVKGEIYDRVYGLHDIQNVVDLFNDIHSPHMVITIEKVEKEVKDED